MYCYIIKDDREILIRTLENPQLSEDVCCVPSIRHNAMLAITKIKTQKPKLTSYTGQFMLLHRTCWVTVS